MNKRNRDSIAKIIYSQRVTRNKDRIKKNEYNIRRIIGIVSIVEKMIENKAWIFCGYYEER